MSNSLISIFFGLGVGGWSYVQLARRNGNATPANNYIAAGIATLVSAVFLFTFLKFVLHF